MPDGRFLSKSIAWSEQIGTVSLEADYLFMRMIPHLDREGRITGAPRSLKGMVCPLRDEMTTEVVERALGELAGSGLVVWYRAQGQLFVEFPTFSVHQQGAHLDRERASRIPSPDCEDAEVVRTHPDPSGQVRLSEVKLSKEKSSSLVASNSDATCAGNGSTALQTTRRRITTDYPPEFDACWHDYPHRPNNSKRDAFRAWNSRVRQKVSHADLHAGTRRYAKYCKARGIEGTEFVKLGSTFYGPSEHWAQPWEMGPQPVRNGAAPQDDEKLKFVRIAAAIDARKQEYDGEEWWERMQLEANAKGAQNHRDVLLYAADHLGEESAA